MHFTNLKITMHLSDSTFCTGCSCDCCSSRMWPPTEEKMNCATAWKGGTCEVIRVKSGPAHNEIFIASADALKAIKLSYFFLSWLTGNAFFCIYFRVKRANLGLQTSAVFSALFQWWHTGSSILCTRFRLLFILLFFLQLAGTSHWVLQTYLSARREVSCHILM